MMPYVLHLYDLQTGLLELAWSLTITFGLQFPVEVS